MATKCSRIGLTLCTVALLASGCSQPLAMQEKSALLSTALGLGAGALGSIGGPSGMLAAGLVSGAAGLLLPHVLGALDGSAQKTNEVDELKRDLAQRRQEVERLKHGEDALEDDEPRTPRSRFRQEDLRPDDGGEPFPRRSAPSLHSDSAFTSSTRTTPQRPTYSQPEE